MSRKSYCVTLLCRVKVLSPSPSVSFLRRIIYFRSDPPPQPVERRLEVASADWLVVGYRHDASPILLVHLQLDAEYLLHVQVLAGVISVEHVALYLEITVRSIIRFYACPISIAVIALGDDGAVLLEHHHDEVVSVYRVLQLLLVVAVEVERRVMDDPPPREDTTAFRLSALIGSLPCIGSSYL